MSEWSEERLKEMAEKEENALAGCCGLLCFSPDLWAKLHPSVPYPWPGNKEESQ